MARDQKRAQDYKDPMARRLLGMAADVLRSFGSAFGGKHLAIIGGAVPSLMVPEVAAGMVAHVGTADLDLHLSLHLLDGQTAEYYDAIIDGLRSLKLEPDRRDGKEIKWRWVGSHRGAALQVELLCPLRDRGGKPEAPAEGTPAEVNIGPTKEITALAVGFGYLVPDDTIKVSRRVEASGGELSYEFPVAGLTSWLCLKADAVMRRDKPKDAYDIVWLLTALGPDEAAKTVAASKLLGGPHRPAVIQELELLIADQFRDIDSIGPRSYATFLEASPGDRERRHAVATVSAFGVALKTAGVNLKLGSE